MQIFAYFLYVYIISYILLTLVTIEDLNPNNLIYLQK